MPSKELAFFFWYSRKNKKSYLKNEPMHFKFLRKICCVISKSRPILLVVNWLYGSSFINTHGQPWCEIPRITSLHVKGNKERILRAKEESACKRTPLSLFLKKKTRRFCPRPQGGLTNPWVSRGAPRPRVRARASRFRLTDQLTILPLSGNVQYMVPACHHGHPVPSVRPPIAAENQCRGIAALG